MGVVVQLFGTASVSLLCALRAICGQAFVAIDSNSEVRGKKRELRHRDFSFGIHLLDLESEVFLDGPAANFHACSEGAVCG